MDLFILTFTLTLFMINLKLIYSLYPILYHVKKLNRQLRILDILFGFGLGFSTVLFGIVLFNPDNLFSNDMVFIFNFNYLIYIALMSKILYCSYNNLGIKQHNIYSYFKLFLNKLTS